MSENGNSGTQPTADADEVPVVEGRRAPFTMVADWVALAEASPQAKLLYVLYAMHVNQGRGDGSVWPRRRWLAEMMGFKQPRSVDAYNRELQALGAIDLEPRWIAPGVRGANLVRVHMTPPDGYDGPASLREHYERRKEGGVVGPTPPPPCATAHHPRAPQRTVKNQTNEEPDVDLTREEPARQLVDQPPGGDHDSAAQAGGTEEEARKILRSASTGLGDRTPAANLAGRLITETAAALARGWTAKAVETALRSSLTGVTDVGRVWLSRLGRDLAGAPTAAPFGFVGAGDGTPSVDPEVAQVRAASLARREAQLARMLERRQAAARFGHGVMGQAA